MTLSEKANLDAAMMLGIRPAPHSPMEWLEVIRQGVPADVCDHMDPRLRRWVTATKSLNVRTLQRGRRHGKISMMTTEKLVRLAMVYARAREVFEPDAATRWLETPVLALGNRAPLEFLDTEIGAQIVLNELGVIDHSMGA